MGYQHSWEADRDTRDWQFLFPWARPAGNGEQWPVWITFPQAPAQRQLCHPALAPVSISSTSCFLCWAASGREMKINGRKHTSRTLNREEVVWDGTWKWPRSTRLAWVLLEPCGSWGDHVPYRHINQKRQFWGFSQALTFFQSTALLEKHSVGSLDVGDFCWPERLNLKAICCINPAG